MLREISGRLLVAAITFLMFGITGAAASEGYRLLRLGGTWVKWGNPALGTHATVSYALVTGPTAFPQARNCKAMDSVDRLLAKSQISRDIFRDELEASFEAWADTVNISFVRTDDLAEADILIGGQKQARGRAYTDVAYRAHTAERTRSIRRSLICLNAEIPWKVGFDGNADVYDLRYTLIHEIGHAIGLDHPGPSGQIMSFQYHEDFRTPQNGDVHGASLLYGSRQGVDMAHAERDNGSREKRSEDENYPAKEPQLSLGEQPSDESVK